MFPECHGGLAAFNKQNTMPQGFFAGLASALLFVFVCHRAMPQVSQEDFEALMALYQAANGENWSNNQGWDTQASRFDVNSSWHGVFVQGGRVRQLILPANNLSGFIPTEIGNLTDLSILNLGNNQLDGSIPTQIGQLGRLMELDLSRNVLDGPIPSETGMLGMLTHLYLYENQLSGHIPDEIGNLNNLRILWLNGNRLSGPIPPQINDMPYLRYIRLQENQLSGPIPSAIGKLPALTNLRLEGNQLSGSLPAALGQLANLEALWVNGNLLSGAVPDEITGLARLTQLHLHNNRFDRLPDLSGLPALMVLRLENNRFHFDALEPHYGMPGDFRYIPQAKTGEEEQHFLSYGESLELSVSVGGQYNSYQWLRNGEEIPGATSPGYEIVSFSPGEEGIYVCRISNEVVSGLTLVSENILVLPPMSDLSITKEGPELVVAGQELVYIIEVFNNGPSLAEEVEVAELMPAGLVEVAFNTDGGDQWMGWNSPYIYGELPPGEDFRIYLRALTVTGLEQGHKLINEASVSSTTSDPIPGNNAGTHITSVETLADLILVKSGETGPVTAGESVIYHMEVGNTGPSDARGVRVEDDIPAGLLNPEFSNDGGSSWSRWDGAYEYGILPAGEHFTILLRAVADPALPGGSELVNQALVRAVTYDPDTTNNAGNHRLTVNAEARLQIGLTADPDTVYAGNILHHTIYMENLGPSLARDVVLAGDLPQGLQQPLYSTDGGNVWQEWVSPYTYGSLSVGDSVEILLSSITDPGLPEGTVLTREVSLSSSTSVPDPGPLSTAVDVVVETRADLALVKTAAPSPVVAGQEIGYTLVVTNNGPSHAGGVWLADSLPRKVVFLGADNNGVPGQGVVNWDLGLLAAGDSVVLNLLCLVGSDVERGSKLYNSALAGSDTHDPDPGRAFAGVETLVKTRSVLSMVKNAPAEPVAVGNEVVFGLRLTNDGPSDAPGIVVTDLLPFGLEFVSAQPHASFDPAAGMVGWEPLGLPAGESMLLELTTLVNTSLEHGSVVVNVAVADAESAPQPAESNPAELLVWQTEAVKIIPNAFMPGSDIPANREFKPDFWIVPQNYRLAIYNRWGSEVFSTSNPQEGWGGTYSDSDAPQGGYIYHVSYVDHFGEAREHRGTLMLIR